MYSNSKLRSAVRLSLGIGAGALAAGYAPGAIAQEIAADDQPLEEIITTGSRIKRADLESASPVTVLDREDIMAQGITDVGNLIQRMPSMSGTARHHDEQRQQRGRHGPDRPARHGRRTYGHADQRKAHG